MISCIALDDEPLALHLITEYSAKVNFINLIHTFTDADEAKSWLNNNHVDLMFLDIQMPGTNGVQFYKSLEKKPQVIFTTAFSEYAAEGFNVDAIDYLLKPFEFERFLKSVQKAKDYLEFLSSQELQKASIFIKIDYQLMKINLKEIELIEGLDDYVRIYIKPKPVLALMTLKSLQEKLPSLEFIRLHRSYIVPINKIESFGRNKVKVNGRDIPIGSSYSEAYQQMLMNKGIHV
jgi:DNA-binding LytR/AlgR family response regulator